MGSFGRLSLIDTPAITTSNHLGSGGGNYTFVSKVVEIIMTPSTSSTLRRKRKLAPAEASSTPRYPSSMASSSQSGSVDADAGDDGEYMPQHTTPKSTARTKNKGIANGRSAALSREALRKSNHSMIERRRREKINAALGELREMVPGLGQSSGGKGGEFKLEVLERTVDHMRDLKSRLEALEMRLDSAAPSTSHSIAQSQSPLPRPTHHKHGSIPAVGQNGSSSRPQSNQPSKSPPSPSDSRSSTIPDSVDSNPPHQGPIPMMRQSPINIPSISDLLTSTSGGPDQSMQPPSKPQPQQQVANPALYLPFPTPSPTSPFLSYSTSTGSNTSLQTNVGPDPSPFMAPMQNMSLFGGALNLDGPLQKENQPNNGKPGKGMEAEEAANVLLAFSSPDTMRPTSVSTTPMMSALDGGRPRRSTLEGENFVLDGGSMRPEDQRFSPIATGRRDHGQTWVGKTARDILKM